MESQKIKSALISVFYKDGIDDLVKTLHEQGVTIYSTGGTQSYIEKLNIPCIAVESVTDYPSILGGRVKTLHPKMFGGILARRNLEQDQKDLEAYEIPTIDLVIVDLYPFEETLKNTSVEAEIIEKIDIGGPSMIRAAAKNFKDVAVIAHKEDYNVLLNQLKEQNGALSLEQRKEYAAKAFNVVMNYDIAINNYFNETVFQALSAKESLRYGENPHQKANFYGDISEVVDQIHGKNLSYNNLVDADAAIQLIKDFSEEQKPLFAIFKHTNACGVAKADSLAEAWDKALAGDPESAFGGVLVTNKEVDLATAEKINDLFFEILIAPAFAADAMEILQSKKNRILLILKDWSYPKNTYKSVLNGVLVQEFDQGNAAEWKEMGAFETNEQQKEDLLFANLICKHLKSNAIALVKNGQLIGKGCGQTSRIDALQHAIDKAKSFDLDLKDSVLASDAFFPFDDCVSMAHKEGIKAIIQPGGSIRDQDSIDYAKNNDMAMVLTGQRHFKH